jgi:hypothetical protein
LPEFIVIPLFSHAHHLAFYLPKSFSFVQFSFPSRPFTSLFSFQLPSAPEKWRQRHHEIDFRSFAVGCEPHEVSLRTCEILQIRQQQLWGNFKPCQPPADDDKRIKQIMYQGFWSSGDQECGWMGSSAAGNMHLMEH